RVSNWTRDQHASTLKDANPAKETLADRIACAWSAISGESHATSTRNPERLFDKIIRVPNERRVSEAANEDHASRGGGRDHSSETPESGSARWPQQ
ncbi:hypothetical protein PybrP1_001961, partial [[Pythium] brassicae (nom. inval.)]